MSMRKGGEELSEHGIWTMTATDGSFRQRITSPDAIGAACNIQLKTGVREGPVLSADVDHAGPIEADEIPIGEVILRPLPIVLSGTIRNRHGEPIDRAHVDLARARESGIRDWLSGMRGTADETGAFTCAGILEPGEYFYKVFAGGHARTELTEFRVGTTGLEIELLEYGELVGSVLVPDGVAASAIVLDVRAPEVEWDPENWRASGEAPLHDGTFRIVELPPGEVDLHLRLDAESPPLWSAGGVVIAPGETTRDPRLQGIDLRGHLHRFDLEIVSSSGESLPSARVAFWPADESTLPPRWILARDSSPSITSPWPVIDLLMEADGFRSQRFEEVDGDMRVVLEPGIAVRVRLAEEVDLPAPPHELEIVLVPTTIAHQRDVCIYSEDGMERRGMYSWWLDQSRTFPLDRELEFALASAGEYLVFWKLIDPTPGSRRSKVSFAPTPGHETVHVDDTAAVQEFELAPDPESLRKALQR